MTEDDERHGTPAGDQAHRREGTEPCQPCRDAWAAYMREFRSSPLQKARTRRYLLAGTGLSAGLALLLGSGFWLFGPTERLFTSPGDRRTVTRSVAAGKP